VRLRRVAQRRLRLVERVLQRRLRILIEYRNRVNRQGRMYAVTFAYLCLSGGVGARLLHVVVVGLCLFELRRHVFDLAELVTVLLPNGNLNRMVFDRSNVRASVDELSVEFGVARLELGKRLFSLLERLAARRLPFAPHTPNHTDASYER
jgi:hypothetical protein